MPDDHDAPFLSAPPTAREPSFWLTRFVLLRLLGAVYAVAFLIAVQQLRPLIGASGLLPADLFLDNIRSALGSSFAGFMRLPSLFWLNCSDTALLTVAWIGLGLSCVVAAGYANSLILAVLWALYMSIVHVGQDWYGYGWEIQLLETGFLAIFLCPLVDARPFPRRAPPRAIIWLFCWLVFRVMLGAGLIKLRGDAGWRDLSILRYFFETQPLPNPFSRWFHFLPPRMLEVGVVWNHVAELGAPLLLLWPHRRARAVAGVVMILFQLSIIISGNLSFLNWLTIVPALACLDDRCWARVLPRQLVQRAAQATAVAPFSRPMQVTSWAVAALVALLSIRPVLNMISPGQIMNTSFDPLELVNTYGAFGSVGQHRYNVVFEGTDATNPTVTNATWKAYPYKGLPVDLKQRPPQVAPYQLRLDWQMWFAAMSTPQEYPWTLRLVWKLLNNDQGTLGLFASNPFSGKPPRYVRAVLYEYKFAPAGNPDGAWWTRTQLGVWLPPLAASDQTLRDFVQQQGREDRF